MKTIHKEALQMMFFFALLIGVLLPGPFALLTLPATWPGFFIFGIDETREQYGYWGEFLRFWLCSFPSIAMYAWLIASWRASYRGQAR
jgi:hypothetical protein